MFIELITMLKCKMKMHVWIVFQLTCLHPRPAGSRSRLGRGLRPRAEVAARGAPSDTSPWAMRAQRWCSRVTVASWGRSGEIWGWGRWSARWVRGPSPGAHTASRKRSTTGSPRTHGWQSPVCWAHPRRTSATVRRPQVPSQGCRRPRIWTTTLKAHEHCPRHLGSLRATTFFRFFSSSKVSNATKSTARVKGAGG